MMKYFAKLASVIALSMSAPALEVGNLWIIGDATPYGWSTDDATALLSDTDTPDVYTGTIYLKADANFKFMTQTDFGGHEYGASPGSSLTDGTIALAAGSFDEGYSQIQVPESANYRITVNTGDMTATIVKSDYQESEIGLCSLFLVGDPMPNGWSVDNGSPLYQDQTAPYIFRTSRLALKTGSFKIASVIKGGGTWDPKYWYFRDAADSNKIALNQSGDLQWNITDAGDYDITVNLLTSAIEIAVSQPGISGISGTYTDNTDAPVYYYTTTGIQVTNPTQGIYIRCQGDKTTKVYLK